MLFITLAAVCGLLVAQAPVANALPPSRGAAAGFCAFSDRSMTNSGSTSCTGNMAISPAASGYSGLCPTYVTGTCYAGTGTTEVAVANAASALYADLATATGTPTAPELGGVTLTPGTYSFTGDAYISGAGTLTLNGAGTYIFKVASGLSTTVGSTVLLTNGATSCNVFWRVFASATIGGSTAMHGTVVAMDGITMGTSASLTGNLFALNAGITLLANPITHC
ncbi:hypothetical protein EDC01DRAFT_758988 [Geopyxis carbonaria]|nr:hypothetical protein EDC01DRAFT_758988 [Geopyxis carbonaria]